MSVGVVIPVFGSHTWMTLAERAATSARSQTVPPEAVVISVRTTLAEARNRGAAEIGTDWLIFLDADDELHPSYVEASLAGHGDVRQPATLGITNGVADLAPVVIPPHPGGWLAGNHVVVGAMVRHELFDDVGGFDDLEAGEDWDLWIRCWLAGACFGVCPDAVYLVHVRPRSRNAASPAVTAAFHQVRSRYRGLCPREPWRARGGRA